MADAFRDRLDECYNALTADDISDWSGSTGNTRIKSRLPKNTSLLGLMPTKKAMALADVVILTTPPDSPGLTVHFEAAVNRQQHLHGETSGHRSGVGIKKVLEVAERQNKRN